MKSYQKLIGLPALLLTLCSTGEGWVIWDRLHTLYPTPEMESLSRELHAATRD